MCELYETCAHALPVRTDAIGQHQDVLEQNFIASTSTSTLTMNLLLTKQFALTKRIIIPTTAKYDSHTINM